MKKSFLFVFCLFACSLNLCLANTDGRPDGFQPTSTHLFAQRDSISLYLDVYEPAPSVEADADSALTVMFVFGGSFKGGSRLSPSNVAWYRMLTERGYRVIAIDYRLGLKGVKKMGVKFVGKLRKAIDMAVEDLFDATAYVLEHSSELGVKTDGIVLAGSSAGAITVLQAEWELCNGRALALPQGFNYAGVMSFAGAIFSNEGRIRYRNMEPCPHFMCHGTIDRIVKYGKIGFMNLNFAGTPEIAKTFIKNGYTYRILRFDGNSHEIASAMPYLIDETVDFLETNVRRGINLKTDALIRDPRIRVPDWANDNARSLYK